MAYRIRIEGIENTSQVAVYVKDGRDYLRVDGALPNFTQQLLREGEDPDPTLILSSEIAQGIADGMAPTPDNSDELLAMLRAQHQEDKATISWMQAVIAKIVGLQAATEEPVG